MNLPDHRRAIHGRTWPHVYRHTDTDAPVVEICPGSLRGELIASVLLAVAIGVGLAVALVAWWTS